ncbi:MAG: hypothetical protein AAFQ41_10645, partial [Cyanobacteria bacterium J06623_7]
GILVLCLYSPLPLYSVLIFASIAILELNAINYGCQIINLYSSTTPEQFYQGKGYQAIEPTFIYEQNCAIPVIYMEKQLIVVSRESDSLEQISQQDFIRNMFNDLD